MVVKVPTTVHAYHPAKEVEPTPTQPEKINLGLKHTSKYGMVLYVIGTGQEVGNLRALNAQQDVHHLEVTCELLMHHDDMIYEDG